MNNRLCSLNLNSNLTESNFGIPPVKLPHNPLCTLGITGNHRNGTRTIKIHKCLLDPLINCKILCIAKSAQIHKSGIHPLVPDNVHRVPGRVSLPDGCKYFSGSQ